MTTERMIHTTHADIAVRTSPGSGLPVILLHGNSSCKEVFRHLLEGDFGQSFALVAIDLPGHGASGNAIAPERTYSIPGYADAILEVLAELGIERAAIFGWSLGGHVGLELASRLPGLAGLMISGTPPVRPTAESLQAGFRPEPLGALFGQEVLSEAEVEAFAKAVYGTAVTAELTAALRRTDGRARSLMMGSLFSGHVADQREIAETTDVPLAIVDGAEDPFINLDYIASLAMPSLWEQHCFVLRGAGHAAFLTHADRFEPIFGRFVADVASRPQRTAGQPAKAGTAKSGASKRAASKGAAAA